MDHARDTDVMLSLRCPSCRAPLSLLTGRHQFSFHCRSGHAFLLRQIFQLHEQEVQRGFRELAEVWREKRDVLYKVAQLAERDGRLELARIFEREADTLEARVRTLNDTGDAESARTG
jgi:hypothetical protein